MQFLFVHQNFNRTSSEMHKNLRKKRKNMEEIRRQTNIGYILGSVYIHYYISGTPCWTYPQGSNIIATSNSKFIFSSFLSICARHDQDKWVTYVHAHAYKKEAMPQVIMWPWQLSTNRANGIWVTDVTSSINDMLNTRVSVYILYKNSTSDDAST